ncbi:hypothetical protein [Streptomyces sp. NPDC091268]|uniref:hypothetical protein n=1 Tax=Streptomyces sp. NPDC091268 TaxID=3365979 RepID=UPI003819B584
MSFGDPNNPYGQQPQGQPGYGYPQQAPQGVPPQGGYAYPQHQAPAPAPQGFGGYPLAYPVGHGGYPGIRMPGLMKTARVLLFIIGGLQLLVGVIAVITGIALSTQVSSSSGELTGGIVIAIGAAALLFALLPIILGARFSKGRGGVRVTTIIYGALGVLGSLGNLGTMASQGDYAPMMAPAVISAVIGLTVSGIILASMVGSSASLWFQRPRY